jgi:ketosteroid isomerase-like protein
VAGGGVPEYSSRQTAAAKQKAANATSTEKLNDQWMAAFNKGDAAAVAAMYTIDAYVLPAHGEMEKRPARD